MILRGAQASQRRWIESNAPRLSLVHRDEGRWYRPASIRTKVPQHRGGAALAMALPAVAAAVLQRSQRPEQLLVPCRQRVRRPCPATRVIALCATALCPNWAAVGCNGLPALFIIMHDLVVARCPPGLVPRTQRAMGEAGSLWSLCVVCVTVCLVP